MSPLLVGLLKRLALWGLVGTALLVVAPPVLTELGVLGPSLDEILDGSERSVETARLYGATDDLPSFRAAVADLGKARDLAGRGEERSARHAARRASAHAIAAQREALARKEAERRRAQDIQNDIDGELNGLEDLYDRVEHRVDKATANRLLSAMKAARQAGAGLILAYEQGSYATVIADEDTVRSQLASYRAEIAKAGMDEADAASRRPPPKTPAAARRAERR
jgi:hypothetical protein